MVNKIYLLVFLIILSACFISTDAQDNCPVNILPESGSIKGWLQKTTPECYNNEHLFEAIDGAAAVYLEYGFVSMARTSYSRKKQKLDIEVYLMTETDAAYGILTNMDDGPPQIDLINGSIIVMKSYYGMAVKGRYFIIITEPTGKGGVSDDIKKFIVKITDKIEENAVIPSIITDLKTKELTRIIYFKGDLVLNNAIYLGITRPFGFDNGIYIESKGIPAIIFHSNIEMAPIENIYSTLERFKDSGKYKIDHENNKITNIKGFTFRIYEDNNNFIIISDDSPNAITGQPVSGFWKD